MCSKTPYATVKSHAQPTVGSCSLKHCHFLIGMSRDGVKFWTRKMENAAFGAKTRYTTRGT
ncbi:unnamed protein product, partial [Mycena citricolor]